MFQRGFPKEEENDITHVHTYIHTYQCLCALVIQQSAHTSVNTNKPITSTTNTPALKAKRTGSLFLASTAEVMEESGEEKEGDNSFISSCSPTEETWMEEEEREGDISAASSVQCQKRSRSLCCYFVFSHVVLISMSIPISASSREMIKSAEQNNHPELCAQHTYGAEACIIEQNRG